MHRGIKPCNILLGADGRAKLGDVGPASKRIESAIPPTTARWVSTNTRLNLCYECQSTGIFILLPQTYTPLLAS
eukprot:scaffold107219_cov22-Prasinocladus_malaysianus.AAC.1